MKPTTSSKKDVLQTISLGQLKKNEWNCNTMTKEEFESLKTSMKTEGQLSPVLVTPRDNYFLIIDGEKRFDVAKDLGWKLLQAMVEEGLTDDQVKVRCFTSHYNRGFLDPIKTFNLFYEEWIKVEDGDAYDDGGNGGKNNKVTTRGLQQKYGVDQSWISRILTIREIPEPVRNYISSLMRDASKRFSITHAIVLAEKSGVIPEDKLKEVIDYFFSPQNKKVESYTDLKFLLGTVVQEVRSENPEEGALVDDNQQRLGNAADRNYVPDKQEKGERTRNNNSSSDVTVKSKHRPAIEGNFDCEGCDSHYMIDWNNRRVLKLTPEDTFVKASEVRTSPARVTDRCPQCSKQIFIDFEEKTFRWS